jgi:hypothetical protein
MLRLTEAQLAQSLAGLNPTERFELLALLEASAAREAERPIDSRPPLSSLFLEFAAATAAQQSGDPDEYLRKHAAHEARRAFHIARLERQRPASEVRPTLAELYAEFTAAGEAAEADGYPKPGRAAAPPSEPDLSTDMEATPEPRRPRLGGRREGADQAPPLPDDVRDDIAQSRARDRFVSRPKPDEAEAKDKLAAFRDNDRLHYLDFPDA